MKALTIVFLSAIVMLSSCGGGHVTGLPKHDSDSVKNYGSSGPADTSKKSSSFGSSSSSSTKGSDTSTTKN